jgi:hypothetical protein
LDGDLFAGDFMGPGFVFGASAGHQQNDGFLFTHFAQVIASHDWATSTMKNGDISMGLAVENLRRSSALQEVRTGVVGPLTAKI